MKNLLILLLAISMLLTARGKTIEPEMTAKPEKKIDEWREAYAVYLNESDFAGFYIGDINQDGFPEVVLCNNETNSGQVCYFTDGGLQVLELWVVSSWGKVGYLEETNQIILLQWYGHTQGTFGSIDYFLYDWTQSGYIETYSLIRESGYGEHNDEMGNVVDAIYGQGYINEKEVDFDEFEAALAEMNRLLEISTWFTMVDADEVEDYSDYLMNWEP